MANSSPPHGNTLSLHISHIPTPISTWKIPICLSVLSLNVTSSDAACLPHPVSVRCCFVLAALRFSLTLFIPNAMTPLFCDYLLNDCLFRAPRSNSRAGTVSRLLIALSPDLAQGLAENRLGFSSPRNDESGPSGEGRRGASL